jgi:hypothetical protein
MIRTSEWVSILRLAALDSGRLVQDSSATRERACMIKLQQLTSISLALDFGLESFSNPVMAPQHLGFRPTIQ